MRQEEMIQVPKGTVNVMIRHFEVLIKYFEKLAERETMSRADRRREEIKKGKVKGNSIKEYSEYMKRKGVNVA